MTDQYAFSTVPGFTYDPLKHDTLIGDLDPFIGGSQTSRLRAYVKVKVGPTDITDRLRPHLISVRVLDGSPSPQAEIEIDDRDAILPLPPLTSRVEVEMGWQSESMVRVFNGLIMDLEHGFGRKQGGRRMWVYADGANLVSSKLKEPIQDNLGEGAPPGKKEGPMHGLPDFLQQVAKHGGVMANVDGVFSGFQRDYWGAQGQSVMHTFQEMAEKFGAFHQFTDGDKVLFEKIAARGLSCMARWKDNLLGWRVRPFNARAAFQGSTQQFYDPKNASWNSVAQNFGASGPWSLAQSNTQSPTPAATENNANQDNQGAQNAGDASSMGNGRIVINGEPNARPNSICMLSGARPGVDGAYYITMVEHMYSRQGYITTLEVFPYAVAPSGQNVGEGWLPKPNPNIG